MNESISSLRPVRVTEFQREVIGATLPAVASAIDAISILFYEKLFAAHPDLLDHLFNRGNQANGAQQRALAGAIARYATLVVESDASSATPLLSRIAHRHVSLGIAPEQYEVVYSFLFEAIAEVLGEAVTADVADAWTAVYWQMAGELIQAESELYASRSKEGPDVWRAARVVERTNEPGDVVALVLKADEGADDLPMGAPGQYVSVQVTLADGARQIRQYSLRASGHGRWQISCRRIPAALGAADGAPAGAPGGEVSTFLHEHVRVGDELRVSLPSGALVLTDDERPVVLMSAGIGSTPLLGMLEHLVSTGSSRPTVLVHREASASRHAHLADMQRGIAALADGRLVTVYSDERTQPELFPEIDELPREAIVYLCGPAAFMAAARTALAAAGFALADIHSEAFGPETASVA